MSFASKHLQAQMQSALLRNQSVPPGLFTPRGEAQFGVYLNAYRARLRGALRENFESLPLLMGDEGFDDLANAYINAHPSQHYSLRWFGHDLPGFMQANTDVSLHPAMVDFARLEWAMRHAFDAANDLVLSASDLTQVSSESWPELHFGLHSSVQVLALNWSVGPIWHALKSGAEEVPEPEPLVHEVLVWRQGLNTQWLSLSEAESTFVQGISMGLNFAELCEKLVEHVGEDQAAVTAATVLRKLLDQGAITPPPKHTSPSYTTALCPGVTAHCGVEKSSCSRPAAS